MKYRNRCVRYCCILLLSFLQIQAYAQQNATRLMDDYWNKFMVYHSENRLETALRLLDSIQSNKLILKSKQDYLLLKNWSIILKGSLSPDDAHLKEIEQVNIEIHAAKDPVVKALWQYRASSLYKQYFLSKKNVILSRSKLQLNSSEDVQTWDKSAFENKIISLTDSFLMNRKKFKRTPILQYSGLIREGVNTSKLRNSVFEFLCFEAIENFNFIQKHLTIYNEKNAIELNNLENYFNYNQFSKKYIATSQDTLSNVTAKMLNLYRELVLFEQQNKNWDALLDADLQRLAFLKDNNPYQHHQKDSLIINAYHYLYTQFPNNEYGGLAKYYELKYKNVINQSTVDTLLLLIDQFPNKDAGILSKNYLNTINEKNLASTLEPAYLPNENILFLLHYKNVKKLNFSIQKLDDDQIMPFILEDEIAKLPLLRTWTQNLPNSSNERTTQTVELKIDALPIGLYNLNIQDDSNHININQLLQVSNLTLFNKNSKNIVLHRKTGHEVLSTKLTAYRYQFLQDRYCLEKINQFTTNKNNHYNELIINAKYQHINGYVILEDTINNDKFCIKDIASLVTFVDSSKNQLAKKNDDIDYANELHTKELIFTDRKIYKAGQKIYFKGYVFTDDIDAKTKALNGIKKTVFLTDPFSNEIDSLICISNEFGTYSGYFNIPKNATPGTYSIETDEESVEFNIEFYKKPTFYLRWTNLDCINDQKNILKGEISSYSGNKLKDVQVQYSIEDDDDRVLKVGSTTTDEKGNFSIMIDSTNDLSSINIYVEMLDKLGSTLFDTISLSKYHNSIKFDVHRNQRFYTLGKQDSIHITSRLIHDCKNTDASINLKINKLVSPDKVYRKRLWQAPTEFIYDKDSFQYYFPDDEFKNEWDVNNRAVEKVIIDTQIIVKDHIQFAIQDFKWFQSGYHQLIINAQDVTGKVYTDTQYIFVLLEDNKITYDKLLFFDVTPLKNNNVNVKLLSLNKDLNLYFDYLMEGKIKLGSNNLLKIINPNYSREIAVNYVLNNRPYSESIFSSIQNNANINVEWTAHRYYLSPNTKEKWTFIIKDAHDKPLKNVEMMATLYDGALDNLIPNDWNSREWDYLYYSSVRSWHSYYSFNTNKVYKNYIKDNSNYNSKTYNDWRTIPYAYKHESLQPVTIYGQKIDHRTYTGAINKVSENTLSKNKNEENKDGKKEMLPSIRSNFVETAFFYPHLKSDKNGIINLEFTVPDALTKWHLKALIHNKDAQFNYFTGVVQSQKNLMITPQLPRFVRQGDVLNIESTVGNLSQGAITGIAKIEIVNAVTNENLNNIFGIINPEQAFNITMNSTALISFPIEVPLTVLNPVKIIVTAKSDHFTDGEEHILPILPIKVLVTESLPIQVKGNDSNHFELPNLLNSKNSPTLVQHGITVEYISNPIWTSILAMPYLMDFPYDCAEQTFNKLFANILAQDILDKNPIIKTTFKKWSLLDPNLVVNKLSDDHLNKSALIAETPWILNATNMETQNAQLAQLFDKNNLENRNDLLIDKIKNLQLSNGAFPWFNGMSEDPYITQYITIGLAKIGLENLKKYDLKPIYDKAEKYLDEKILENYQYLVKNKLKDSNINAPQIQYLYWKSISSWDTLDTKYKEAYDYFLAKCTENWTSKSLQLQAMIAWIHHVTGDKKLAQTIITSLKERAIKSKIDGTYWKLNNSLEWHDNLITTHTLLLEAIHTIQADEAFEDEIKNWLIQQKRANHWSTTIGTASVIDALLNTGSKWIAQQPQVEIQLGKEKVISISHVNNQNIAEEIGIQKKLILPKDVKSEMGNIQVKVTNTSQNANSYGSLSWQYFEDINKVNQSTNPNIQIDKKLYHITQHNNDQILKLVDSHETLSVGDKIMVRIIIRTDENISYLHLKDLRASCFEPMNLLSGFKYTKELNYYEYNNDFSTNFFIEYMSKGTYIIEYPLIINRTGTFTNGIATIQSMYAPEYNAHTTATQLQTK